jgi:hypothetical protein
MANFTMAELVALVGQGEGSNTSHDHVPVQKRIYDVVMQQGRCSRSEIATALKLKKTPWLHANIEQLVIDGKLNRSQTVRPNGVVMFWYDLPGKTHSGAARGLKNGFPDWLLEQSRGKNDK